MNQKLNYSFKKFNIWKGLIKLKLAKLNYQNFGL